MHDDDSHFYAATPAGASFDAVTLPPFHFAIRCRRCRRHATPPLPPLMLPVCHLRHDDDTCRDIFMAGYTCCALRYALYAAPARWAPEAILPAMLPPSALLRCAAITCYVAAIATLRHADYVIAIVAAYVTRERY